MDAVQTCGKLWGTQYLEEGASALQSFKLGQSMDVEEIPSMINLKISPKGSCKKELFSIVIPRYQKTMTSTEFLHFAYNYTLCTQRTTEKLHAIH